MAPNRIVASAVLVAAGSFLISACSTEEVPFGESPSEQSVGPSQTPIPAASGSAEECSNSSQISEWTLDRRLTQILMGAVSTDDGTRATNAAAHALRNGSVGGVNFLGSNVSAFRNSELADVVEASGQLPPLLAVDEEGGRVQRLSAIVGPIPSARVMGTSKTPEQVKAHGRRIGEAMRRLSLNMDFAPVVDVGTRAIGDRTFSDDPDVVTEYAGSFAAGLRKAGVIPTLKHFPGLGSATGNTDFGAATTPPISALRKTDLKPYKKLLDDQPVTVMFANAVVPGLTKGTPASLSPEAYELLREDLSFDGVAITDSLSAAAIARDRTVPEAAEQAIAAGADIALWDDLSHAEDVKKRLKQAVRKGRLSEERINESVNRIVALKGADLCEGPTRPTTGTPTGPGDTIVE